MTRRFGRFSTSPRRTSASLTLVYAGGLLVMLLLILLFGRYAAMSISEGVDALTAQEQRESISDARLSAQQTVYHALGQAQRAALEATQPSE